MSESTSGSTRNRYLANRRHPAEVTSDRLAEAVERWYNQFDPQERDMVARIRHRLESIAEGSRG